MTPADYAATNIEAKHRALGIWDFVKEVRFVTADRLYFVAFQALSNRLAVDGMHFSEDLASSAAHNGIYQVFKHDIRVAAHARKHLKLKSYREKSRPSLQITILKTVMACYGDMDIDLSSPSLDVYGFLVHLVEVLTPGVTSHQKLRKKLKRDPKLKEFFA